MTNLTGNYATNGIMNYLVDDYKNDGLSKFAKSISSIARGLSKALVSARDELPPLFGRRYGSAKAAKNHSKETAILDRHANYRVLGDKTRGVEPGFIALLDWTKEDSENVVCVNNELHAAAQNAILNGAVLDGLGENDDLSGRVIRNILTKPNKNVHPILRDFSENILDNIADKDLAAHIQMILPELLHVSPESAQNFATNIIKNVFKNKTNSIKNSKLPELIKNFIMAKNIKFNERHYVKLDYYEEDRFRNKYRIPIDKAVGGFYITRLLHRIYTGQTARDRNQAAVREVLANDLMRLLGVESQELNLIKGMYSNGTPKLMLDGTHVNGFKDFNGAPNKGDIYIKDGVFVRNAQINTKTRSICNDSPILDTSIDKLGRNKILMLLLSDRDALGSKGANKGYVGNRFIGIDPGHALNPKLLKKTNDVYSDFSFRQPSLLSAKNYKNFSVFDQSPLAEKMEGVRQIKLLKESLSDEKLFNIYKNLFKINQIKELNFYKDINKIHALYKRRRDAILNIFNNRLQVDNFKYGEHVKQEEKNIIRDNTLNLLDCLEKLTSNTTLKTKNDIYLMYPQIRKISDRHEWFVKQNPDNSIKFYFKGTTRTVKQVYKDFEAYRKKQTSVAIASQMAPDSKSVSFTVPVDKVSTIATQFSYAKINKYKH